MTGMKDAYSTKELAQLLSVTVKSVLARAGADRENWEPRPSAKRGGGNEWLVASMPENTRHALATAIASRIAQESEREYPRIAPALFTVNTLIDVPEHKRQRATARALLVNLARNFMAMTGSPRTTAYEVFCHEYNRGAIETPEWVRSQLPSVCRKSVTNWEDTLSKQGLFGISGKQGQHRKGSGIIDSTPGMADIVIAHIIKFYEVAAEEVMEALEVTHKGQPLPSLRGLQRWMKAYRTEHARTIEKIQNPDGWRSKYQAAVGSRSAGIERINQLWELDSSPADVLLKDGKRYTVIGGIDVATRRARIQLAKTSSAQGVCSLLRRMLTDFGVPETIKMDNGADYTSFRVTAVLADLQIHSDICTPFSPEEKPHIERFFGTFQRRLKKQPGFIGHSVADRKAIESRRSFAERISRKKGNPEERPLWEMPYTPEEFQKFCDHFCANKYGERKHSALGMSPNEAAARAIAEGTPDRITNERALDILLMPAPGNNGIRTVHKDGIYVAKGTYMATALGAFIGDDVRVRLDEDNAGYIYVFALDLKESFICRAEDPDLTGVSLQELALATKRLQKAVENEKAKEAKKIVAKVKPQELIPHITEMQQQQAAENHADRELRFGAEPSREYTTPALEQAALAARFDDAPTSSLTPEEHDAMSAHARQIMTDERPRWKIPASDPEKYAECLRLMGAEVAGMEIPFEAANWMRAWQNSRTFKTFEATRLGGEQAKVQEK